MPPNFTPANAEGNPARACEREHRLVHDAATRHPVFFTEKLKKAPEGVRLGDMRWASPVARGYVFNDGERREAPARL